MSGMPPANGDGPSGMTRAPWWRAFAISLAMCAAAFAAPALKPGMPPPNEAGTLRLEQLVPPSFAGWVEDPAVVPLQVSPDVQASLDRLYSETLSRTYVNASGQRVMLSVAFGAAQSKATQVHRPEVCYPAQGFLISDKRKDLVHTATGDIPVMRLVSRRGARTEPITYWIRVGEELVRGGLEQKLAGVRQGFEGSMPDGLLFRVSSIGAQAEGEYRIHDRFIGDLLGAVDADVRRELLGSRL